MSTYKINGMTCEGCVNSVTKALQAALAGTQVTVTLTPPEIEINGDHDPKAVEQCVEDAGFDFAGPA